MNAPIIGLSGRIASGKTTLAATVAETLGWPRASFGDYVRSVALERGVALERPKLQALGEELFNADGIDFCNRVLAAAGYAAGCPIIVDGVRHLHVADVLAEIAAPSRFHLVYVDADSSLRHARLRDSRGEDSAHVAEADAHSTENEVPMLREMASLVVDSSEPVNVIAAYIINWIRVACLESPLTEQTRNE